MKSQNCLLAFLLVFASIAGLRGQCPNPPLVNMVPDVVLTCVSPTVWIQPNVAAGQPPYTYLWSDGSTSGEWIQSNPGIFCVTVTDAAGCTGTDCVVVQQDIAAPSISVVQNGSLDCGGSGSATLITSVNPSGAVIFWTGPNGFFSNQQNPTITTAGLYTVVATLPNGCTSDLLVAVLSNAPLIAGISVENITCPGFQNFGQIVVEVSNGSSPFTYQLTGPNSFFIEQMFDPSFEGLPAGTYQLKVIDANGCESQISTVAILEPAPIEVDFSIDQSSCGTQTVIANPTGGTAPWSFSWGGPGIGVSQSGTYSITITDANGCIYIDSVSVGINADSCALITGHIRFDENENCLFETGETGLANWILEATDAAGLHFYGYSDSTGNYEIHAPVGNYMVSLQPNGPFWNICQATQPAIISSVNDIDTLDFLVKAIQICPHLTVDLSSNQLRRCFSNNFYWFTICNDGTAAASDFQAEIQLDPFLSPTNSSVPYTNLGGGLVRFEFDSLAVGDCQTHWLQVDVSCDATLGQTHCSEATVALADPCGDPTAANLLAINHLCEPDSLHFSIENVASPIPVAFEYVVIEDAVMHVGGSTTLQPGLQTTVAVPSNGSTWRVEAVPIPPLDLFAVFRSVEGCGTNATGEFSTGFVVQFAQNTIDPSIDIDCRPNIGSYDPNDKSALPTGFGAAHFIDNQTVIDYQIRFQNTGTDTAFTVVVRDTLPVGLDVNTFRPGSASHNYDLEIDGRGILIFRFEHILLPDSFVNEAASHGFLTFEIQPENDLPDGSKLENRASIYFDFNAPILTNTVFHTIGHEFVPSGVQVLPTANSRLTVAPNPFDESAIFEIEKGIFRKTGLLRIFDSRGLEMRREEVGLPKFEVRKNGLTSGIYWFSLSADGAEIGSGRVIVR